MRIHFCRDQVCVYVCVCACVCMYVCVYVYIHTYVCMLHLQCVHYLPLQHVILPSLVSPEALAEQDCCHRLAPDE